jgi:threonine dehydratase
MVQGKTVVAITSGANMNFDRLRLVADLANFGLRTEAMLTVSIPEAAGEFLKFVDKVQDDSAKITVSELKYRYSVDREAKILFSLLAEGPEVVDKAVRKIAAAGYDVRDITSSSSAQVHLRHMVGGRPRSYSGVIEDEKILVVRGASQGFN